MQINIPCIDCVHFYECGARKRCIKDLLAGRLTCYDFEPQTGGYGRADHKMPYGAHLFNRKDAKYSLPDTGAELESLNADYRNALRPSILQLLQICEQLIRST